ncbi:MAG: flagellar basal-body rod protein FlgG [Planctomycetales bacterium]|nr:flagellar basal-body rod protein FlgG [Planctomycetales bacterium]
MSIQTLYTAATGMTSMQTKLDVIANNLANINTTAFKKDRANFEDLFYRIESLPGAQDANGIFTPTGIEVGLGSRVQSTQTDYQQGDFQNTNRELDVLIEGEGFLQVIDPNSQQILYTRAGNLNINADGNLVTGSAQTGRLIEPAITIPQDATKIQIGSDGQVSVLQPGSPNLNQVGQLQLATFINPDGLLKLGENLYAQTDASNTPIIGNPGQDGLGVIRQNYLEASNVEPVRELIDLITTQRAFELNSQTVQAGDQMLQLIGNLRRF